MKQLRHSLLALFALGSVAFGSQISDNASLSLTATNFTYGVHAPIALDQFDPSLGTLNFIKLEFTITDQYSLQLAAGGTDAEYTGGFAVGVTGFLRGPNNGSLTNALAGAGGYTVQTDIGPSDITVPANTTAPTTYANGGGTTSTLYTIFITANSWADWTGLGTVSLQARGLQTTSGTSSNPVIIGTGAVGVSALVTYDYSAPASVPEPATMSLLGVSLVGLVAARKRFAR